MSFTGHARCATCNSADNLCVCLTNFEHLECIKSGVQRNFHPFLLSVQGVMHKDQSI